MELVFQKTAVHRKRPAQHEIHDSNRRFAKPPASDHDAHRALREDKDLRQILAYRVSRKVTASLTMDLPLFAPESMNTTAYSALP
jgi:hypothetical protein